MNVNQKGVRGLIKCLDDLHSKGYYSFPAFDDHCPVDIIVMSTAGRIFRLQVKYRSLDSANSYQICASSVVNGKRVPINRELIDGWAVYLEEHKKMVYIPTSLLIGRKSISIKPDIEYKELSLWD